MPNEADDPSQTTSAQHEDSNEGSDSQDPGVASVGNAGSGKQNDGGPANLENAAAPVISYAGTVVKPDESTQYNLPGVGTIIPGGPPVTTDNVVYSLAPSAADIVSDFATMLLAVGKNPQTTPVPKLLTVGGSVYTADSSPRYIVGGWTVTPGAPAITVSGTPISLAPSASLAVVGTSTQILGQQAVAEAPILSFDGSTYAAGSSSAFVIDGQTLTPGGSANVNGVPIAYPSGGSNVVIGTGTQTLGYATAAGSHDPIITFGRSTYAVDLSSDFIIGGQTLTPGGALTISGTPIA